MPMVYLLDFLTRSSSTSLRSYKRVCTILTARRLWNSIVYFKTSNADNKQKYEQLKKEFDQLKQQHNHDSAIEGIQNQAHLENIHLLPVAESPPYVNRNSYGDPYPSRHSNPSPYHSPQNSPNPLRSRTRYAELLDKARHDDH